MTATHLPLQQYHANRQLFSDHYLNTILPQRPEWKLLVKDPLVQNVLEQIKAILPTTTNINEAQTERDVIRPVLELLGHTFEVQPSLVTSEGTKHPDYVLYRDQSAVEEQKGKILTEEMLQHTAFAIADAKYWGRPLDMALKKSNERDRFSNKNPAYQIDFYMRHSGVAWGILTNGQQWRIYHYESSKKLDRFYEVDLPKLISTNDPRAFLYFYAFFHRSAFDEHPLSLSAIRHESINSAQGISDNIKQQVYDALRHLAQGFLDYTSNQFQTDDATLKNIYDHSLIVLYRLLFILYAEARALLLPLQVNTMYRKTYSLYAIAHDFATYINQKKQFLSTTAVLWTRLLELFEIIDQDNVLLNIATFNGGLFDPQRYPFLEKYKVGDARLLNAIDLLTRVDGEFVNYRDLAEQHLGTIYEGLLENHLRLIHPEGFWTIDLFNDKGERKVTGSYYTPNFVVEYMVEETLGHILAKAVENASDDATKVQAVLQTKVLDPSMGSGHFLVAATEYIARFLVDIDVSNGDVQDETDLAHWKRRVAQSCIYGVDINPLAVDLAKLSLWIATVSSGKPLSFFDHHLRCGNALVGANLNDLRPSNTMVQKKTKRKTDQDSENGQLSMLDDDSFRQGMSSAVGSMWLIERTVGNTVAEVHEQERLYEELRDQLIGKYGGMADLVSATSFGVEIESSLWNLLCDYTTGRTMMLPPKIEQIVIATAEQAKSVRFFHWELEFPEIFFDEHGLPLEEHAGFDVVLGNPPYVRQETLVAFKPYFARAFADVYHGVADLYIYFYQQGLRVLKPGGRMSYIVTNKWMRSGYGEPLRGYFVTNAVLEQIIDFGHTPIFPDADVFPCIVVLSRPTDATTGVPEDQQVHITEFPREMLGNTTLPKYVEAHKHCVPQQRFSTAAWNLWSSDVDELLVKIQSRGVPMKTFVGCHPYRGIITGLNEIFLIDTPTKERLVREDAGGAEILKPCLRGQDIKRWSPEWDGMWMILLKSSSNQKWLWSEHPEHEAEMLFQQTYPSLYAHMKPMEQRLRQRKNQGRYWWELQSCTFYDLFEQPKIITQDLATYSWFCLDNEQHIATNTCYIWSTKDLYILGWLCSPLTWWVAHRTLQHSINDTLRMFREQVETLPIAPPTDEIRAEVEPIVARLIAITKDTQETRHTLLNWLAVEFDIKKPGQRLQDFAKLNVEEFVTEVRKRRPKGAAMLKPAQLKILREGYQEQAVPAQKRYAEAQQLEYQLADLINAAYGLTPEEVDLLWRTAPPRMPVDRSNAT